MADSSMFADVGKNILCLIYKIRGKENCTFFTEHHCIKAIIAVVVTVSTIEDKSLWCFKSRNVKEKKIKVKETQLARVC